MYSYEEMNCVHCIILFFCLICKSNENDQIKKKLKWESGSDLLDIAENNKFVGLKLNFY